jgi:hypothetical protein
MDGINDKYAPYESYEDVQLNNTLIHIFIVFSLILFFIFIINLALPDVVEPSVVQNQVEEEEETW